MQMAATAATNDAPAVAVPQHHPHAHGHPHPPHHHMPQPRWVVIPYPPPHPMVAAPPPPPLQFVKHLAPPASVTPPPPSGGFGGNGGDENRTIWVGDLHYWMDENYLHSCFGPSGEVGFLPELAAPIQPRPYRISPVQLDLDHFCALIHFYRVTIGIEA
jgi:hypothetical protein